MRLLIQRVTKGSVTVDGQLVSEIGQGLVVLCGFNKEDAKGDIDYCTRKLLGLRVFSDDDGKMNLSVKDVGGEILLVSQFTLYGDVSKGMRPSFTDACGYEAGEVLYQQFIETVKESGITTKMGIYGADMTVEIHNDGPVTLLVESK